MKLYYPDQLDSFNLSRTREEANAAETSIVPSSEDILRILQALQSKVGANYSAVTTSIDYRVAQLEARPIATGLAYLNGLTSLTQTFGNVNDTNVTLSIASSQVTNKHTFTVGWSGSLAKSRMHTATAYEDEANLFTQDQQISAGKLLILQEAALGFRHALYTSGDSVYFRYDVGGTDSTMLRVGPGGLYFNGWTPLSGTVLSAGAHLYPASDAVYDLGKPSGPPFQKWRDLYLSGAVKSGSWQGTAIAVGYGGTGATSLGASLTNSGSVLDAIQPITVSSRPQFLGIGINVAPSSITSLFVKTPSLGYGLVVQKSTGATVFYMTDTEYFVQELDLTLAGPFSGTQAINFAQPDGNIRLKAPGSLLSSVTQTLPELTGYVGITDALFTVGSIPFATSGGLLSQSNSNLFWDGTNNKLGVGTSGPQARVDASGTIRATNTSTLSSGTGVEILYSTGSALGKVQVYDRSGAAFKDLHVDGLTVRMAANGTEQGRVDTTGFKAYRTTHTWPTVVGNGAHWALLSSYVRAVSPGGLIGVTGCSRASDNTGPNISTIGVAGFVINDDASQNSWGLYSDIQHETGNASFGLEVAAKNKGANRTSTSYVRGTPGVCGLWLAGGGDDAYGGAPTNPSNTAVYVVKNKHTWNKGIVFEHIALTGSDGTTGTAIAIEMAKGHTINWRGPSNIQAALIRSDVSTTGQDVGILFQNNTISIHGTTGITIANFTHQSSAVNYLGFTNSATGSALQISAQGSDSNIDLELTGKGSGILALLGMTNVSGTFRATGVSTLTSGVGVEINYSSGSSLGKIQAYDRSGSAFKDLHIDGATIRLAISSTEKVRLNSTGVSVGSTTVTSLFNVGSSAQFQINSSGVIVGGTWQGTTVAVGYGGTGVTSLSDIIGTTNQVNVSGGAARVIGGNVTLSLPQDINATASPTFDSMTLSSVAATTLLTLTNTQSVVLKSGGSGANLVGTSTNSAFEIITNNTSRVTISAGGVMTLTSALPVGSGGTGVTSLSDIIGTTNQVSVSGGAARVIGGNVTLSLPQDIHTGAGPTFDTLTLTTSLTSPIVQGSTSSAGNLTLKSTSHGTKAKILFGTSAYDEVNNFLGLGTTTPGVVTAAGRTYLTISGSTLAGVTEFITQQADASGNAVGIIQFSDINSSAADKRVAAITGNLNGSTANNRGGDLIFYTKADAASGLVERLRIMRTGNIGIGTSTFGTSAATVLGLFNGTAPSTSPADTIQVYSTDLVAGDAALHVRTETGSIFRFGTWFCLPEVASNPTTSVLSSLTQAAIYMKADKLVIAYNNGGTMTYISIPMDGATTTWTHSTSAP